jgi:hypothetical protein
MRRMLLAAGLAGLLAACKGGPPIGGFEPPSPLRPVTAEGDLPAEALPAGEGGDVAAEADASEPFPAEDAVEFSLLEPSLDLAEEAFLLETPPPEASVDSALPEPSALALEAPPPEEPAAPPAALPDPPAETVSQFQPPAETPPEQVRPSPPPFIRPAEIAPPPPAAREPVPLPVNPVPDLPAREPEPVQAEGIQ